MHDIKLHSKSHHRVLVKRFQYFIWLLDVQKLIFLYANEFPHSVKMKCLIQFEGHKQVVFYIFKTKKGLSLPLLVFKEIMNRKNMKKNISAIMILFCSFLSIGQEKEIKELLEKQRINWNKGDMIGYMQGYLKSDSLIFVDKTGPTYGWQKNAEIYQKIYPDKAAMGYLTFDIKQVKMIDKKHAFVLGAYNLQMEKENQKGFFTLLVEKFKDGWKIVVDHSS